MFGLKKIKTNIEPALISLKSWLSPLSLHLNDRMRIKSRIRLANRWASRHPKRLMITFLISMLFIGIMDAAVSSFISRNKNMDSKGMLMVNPMFNGMHRIQANREGLKQQIQMVVDEGNGLVSELDSLEKIPLKTREDTVRMKDTMRRLKAISKILQNEKD